MLTFVLGVAVGVLSTLGVLVAVLLALGVLAPRKPIGDGDGGDATPRYVASFVPGDAMAAAADVAAGHPLDARGVFIDTELMRSLSYASLPAGNRMESCLWANLLAQRLFTEVSRHTFLYEKLIQKIERKLNKPGKPDIIGPIKVTKLEFGRDLPTVDGVRLLPPATPGEWRAEAAVQYNGGAGMVVATHVSLVVARLPISLRFRIASVAAKAILIIPEGPNPACHLAFNSEPRIRVESESVVGHASKIKTLPLVSSFIVNKIIEIVKVSFSYPLGICFHVPMKGQRIKLRSMKKELRKRVERARREQAEALLRGADVLPLSAAPPLAAGAAAAGPATAATTTTTTTTTTTSTTTTAALQQHSPLPPLPSLPSSSSYSSSASSAQSLPHPHHGGSGGPHSVAASAPVLPSLPPGAAMHSAASFKSSLSALAGEAAAGER